MATRPRKRAVAAAASEFGSAPAVGAKGRYDAGGNGRRLASWRPGSAGPNRSLDGIEKVRDRARDVVRNDWAGESHSQKWSTTLIGVGIVPRFNRITNDNRRLELKDLWDDWVNEADADGGSTYYGLQTLAVRAWLESGEVFLRLRPRRANAPMESVPLQVQLLESDLVPHVDYDVWPGMADGHKIRQGIELNRIGQRVAYWMFREHPEDIPRSGSPSIDMLIRVPAEQVSHIYAPARPGALRGVSALASVLVRLRNIADLDDAVLDRQKLANLFAMFITRAMPSDWQDIDTDPLTGLPKWYMDGDHAVATLESGMSRELLPGEDVKFANPPEAGTMYHEYMRTQNMGTAAGAGMPYELHSGDIRNVSDRTLRVLILEYRRFARQRQWQVIIPRMCQPVVGAFAAAGVLNGKIQPSEYDAVRRATWSPDGFEHIHPVQDPQGKIMEIDAGLRSRDEVIAERGDDPTQVDLDRKAAKERAERLNLDPPPAEPKPGQGQQQQPSALDQAQITMLGGITALASREAAAPVVHVTNHLPAAAPVTVNNHVPEAPAPVVQVTNQVPEGPAPVVNVTNHVPEAPAPAVTVVAQAGETKVHATLEMPDRESTTEVVRGEDGEIVKSKTIEKTLQ
jgi:lambda family phage portal protein